MKKLLFTCFIVFAIPLSLISQDTTIIFQLAIPIIGGNNDVEEQEDGSINFNSTDLELINDNEDQVVGLHFENIPIPQGTPIDQAYIQFWTDEISTGAADLEVFGEAVDHASNFNNTTFDISNRVSTNIVIDWTPNNWWIVGEGGEDQRTPNIGAVLQEIVDRPNWDSGNSINLMVSGSGKRVAESFNGAINLAPQLIIEFSLDFSTTNLENVFINELMASNSTILDEYGESDDWVEIYNDNEEGIILNDLYISDDLSDTTKWQFPAPIFIFPKSYSMIWLDDSPNQGTNHVPFKLSSGGESVIISQKVNDELVVLDEISFGALSENVSYGRELDGNNNWVYFGNPTPNTSNNGSELFLNASIDFSIPGGFYSNGTTLSLSSDDPSAEIRYTLDGSQPTATSLIYNNSITLNSTTLVKARAFKPGFISSLQKEEFYLINNTHDLPVVQISIDPHYLWDEQEGFYITGENGITGNCSNFVPRNWNQNWERPISIRYFEPDGTEGFNLSASMKIAGGCSRAFAMKPFNVFFRENKLEYPVFDQLNFQEFKRLKLRMSGNDHPLTMIRDASIHAMLYDQVDIDLMAYEPVVVYLNNEYWGFYGLREMYNKHYLEAHHHVDKDSLDLIKNPYNDFSEIKEGDKVAWNELTEFIENNSIQSFINYDFINSKMDMNEFMNYNIAEMYAANYDWPANNIAVWRDRNDGKFRWLFYDLDISSGFAQWSPSDATFNAIEHATTTTGADWPNNPQSTLFLRKIVQNQVFQNEFVQRTCTFGQTIFAPDRAEHFIDSLSARVESEIPGLLFKFFNPPSEWYMWGAVPVGGTIGAWNGNLNQFKGFWEDRMDNVLNNYENFFDLAGHFNLNINFDETTNGRVVFHTNEMKIPYQYSGKYFNNVPLQIKAIPDDGYYFWKWLETGDTTEVINFSSNIDAILTPLFLPEGTVSTAELEKEIALNIFPNPASTELFISYDGSKNKNLNLRIYDVIGNVVFEKNTLQGESIQQISININEWARGVYILKGSVGEIEITKKIIID